MNTLKKWIALGMTLCLALSLCACGQAENSGDDTTPAETSPATTAAPATTAPQETVDPNLVEYTVYIVDEEGNPVSGGMIQFCLTSCSPVLIDENGTAKFTGEAADYEVKFLNMPAGYTYSTEEEVFHFEAGKTELTLVLKPEA